MATKLERSPGIDFDQNHQVPSCLWPWGVAQVLGYTNSSHNFEKLHPRVKCGRRKHNTRYGNLRAFSLNHYNEEEVEKYLSAEATPLGVEPRAIERRSTDENVMKPLIFNELPAKPWLRHSNLIHCSDPSSEFLCEIQSHKFTDGVEMFEVDKSLFLQVLNDLDFQESKAKFMLAKSGTFPLVNSLQNLLLKKTLSALEHKQMEIRSFPVRGKLQNKATSRNPEKNIPVTSSASRQERNRNGWLVPFMSYLKGIKKNLKQAIKEHKKQNKQLKPDHSETISCYSVYELDNREDTLKMKRVLSLNESAGPYTRLFQSSLVQRRQQKWHPYKSLRLSLSNEDENRSGGDNANHIKFFRRRLSMSDLDSYINMVDYNRNKCDIDSVTIAVKSPGHEKQEATSSVNSSSENSIGDLDTYTFSEELLAYEGKDTASYSGNIDIEVKFSICIDSNAENFGEKTHVDNHSLDCGLTRPNDTDDDDFNYVRRILEASGFLDQDNLETWHSLDQPLGPALLKQLEANYLHNCDHLLLFDITNEVLLEAYENSLAYFPKSVNFYPSQKGPRRVIEQVWNTIGSYRNLGPKKDSSLDDITAQDIIRAYGGWMNLRFDVEDVALDLEDVIFDEIIDEILKRL